MLPRWLQINPVPSIKQWRWQTQNFTIFFTHKKRCLFSVGKIIFGTSFFQVSCEILGYGIISTHDPWSNWRSVPSAKSSRQGTGEGGARQFLFQCSKLTHIPNALTIPENENHSNSGAHVFFGNLTLSPMFIQYVFSINWNWFLSPFSIIDWHVQPPTRLKCHCLEHFFSDTPVSVTTLTVIWPKRYLVKTCKNNNTQILKSTTLTGWWF